MGAGLMGAAAGMAAAAPARARIVKNCILIMLRGLKKPRYALFVLAEVMLLFGGVGWLLDED